MNRTIDDIRRRVQVDTNRDYEWGAMYRDIRVLMEEYDNLLAVARAAREYVASGGNGGIERSFVDERVFCGECFANYVDNICAHENFCAWGKLEAALAALEGNKQGEGEG